MFKEKNKQKKKKKNTYHKTALKKLDEKSWIKFLGACKSEIYHRLIRFNRKSKQTLGI